MSSTFATHIMIGRRRVRRFVHHPKPVNDGTVRCFACGQIDEPGYHDDALCPATSADVSDRYAVVRDPANDGAWQVRAPEGFLAFTTKTCGPQTLKEAQKTAAISNGELAKRYGEAASQGVTFDLIQHLHRQREFSERTFGPGARTAGVIDHIRKELREIEAAPADLNEWIDVVLLAFDGAWRSGASPEAISAALLMKQTRNEARTWPDWRTSDPNKAIEHDRSGETLLSQTSTPDDVRAEWSKFQNDFNAMTDAQVDHETHRSQEALEEAEGWLEAVAAWDAAGRPRGHD